MFQYKKLGSSFQGSAFYITIVVLLSFFVNTKGIPLKDSPKLDSKDSFESHYTKNSVSVTDEFFNYSVIHPQIYNKVIERNVRSTLDPENGLHAEKITLIYYHNNEKVELDLRRSDDLSTEIQFINDQNLNSSEGEHRNLKAIYSDVCHYQGIVNGKPNSKVAISTCFDEINGVVFSDSETYYIHFDKGSSMGNGQNSHLLFKHSDMKNKNLLKEYREKNISNNNKRKKRSSQEYPQMNSNFIAETRQYSIKLSLSVDKELCKHFDNNVDRIFYYLNELINTINMLLKPLNINVILSYWDLWIEDNKIEYSTDPTVTLANFVNYRREIILPSYLHDHAQLLVLSNHFVYPSVNGISYIGKMCSSEKSGAVIFHNSRISAGIAVTMAHELGHSLGIDHDPYVTACSGQHWIMDNVASSCTIPLQWSKNSIEQLNDAFANGSNACLKS